MRRKLIPELLDSDAGTPQEVAGSLADLCLVNRWFGGVRSLRKMLEEVASLAQVRQLSLLDVAAGAGDVAAELSRQSQRREMRLEVTLLDRSPAHLTPAVGMQRIAGDALALPFCDRSFDVVASSLFLHHLQEDEAVQFLSDALRVCRIAVLISDLRRSWLHLALT